MARRRFAVVPPDPAKIDTVIAFLREWGPTPTQRIAYRTRIWDIDEVLAWLVKQGQVIREVRNESRGANGNWVGRVAHYRLRNEADVPAVGEGS